MQCFDIVSNHFIVADKTSDFYLIQGERGGKNEDKIFEKILTVFVILMALCFMAVFFLVSPDFLVIASGIVPSIPDEPGAFGLVAAMAGTTCSAAVFIVRSTVVKEKGWTIDNLKDEKRDAFVSSFMMLLLSGLIMAVAAGTLHVMGLKLDNTCLLYTSDAADDVSTV